MNLSTSFYPSVSTTSIIAREEIFKLIDVHNPYYALKEVTFDDNNIASAKVEIEQPIGSEVFPISSAEASRHMAILGSVACAMNNPLKKKHFYLAHSGFFRRIVQREFLTSNELIVNAQCISLDKRKGCAHTSLLDENNNVICEAEIFYHVVPYSVFERLYQSNYKQHPDFKEENPYLKKNQLFDIRVVDSQATASLGRLPDHYCAGHFPNFPAMPVAILINNLIDLASLYIYYATRDYSSKIMVKEFSLNADNLGFSGEEVYLQVNRKYSSDNIFILNCIATSTSGQSIGDVTLTIETVKNR